MSEARKEKNRSIMNWIGLGLLAISYAMALYHMWTVKTEELSDDKVVIRIVHWQLETGVRDAIDQMAAEFEKEYEAETGKQVKIIQIPIGEKAYRQYVTTQCIGGTAPDLIEMGRMDPAYVARFFVPMTEYVFKPNPYNKGTDLENVAWKDTFFDGLSGAFDQLSLEYYAVGFSTFTVRFFYNKDIFREALGRDDPPKDFADFLDICKRLEAWARENGKTDFVPVAAARYQVGMIRGRYENSVILEFMLRHDRDYDGQLGGMERLMGYCSGDFDYTDPAIEAGRTMVQTMTRYFAPGFMQMGRMEAGFQFAQQNAAFITSGSWDAYSFMQQADFEIGICDMPLPTRETPEIGKFVKGGLTESSLKSGFQFGMTRFSKHPDVVIRFLQFMTSRKRNQEFNRIFKWIPVINGTEPHPAIAGFKPIKEGFWSTDPMCPGSDSRKVCDQHLWDFLQHKTNFKQFVAAVEKDIPAAHANDYRQSLDFLREDAITQGTKASGYLAALQFAGDDARNRRDAEKLAYIWEARVGRFAESTRWPREWQQLLEANKPRAKKVDERIFRK